MFGALTFQDGAQVAQTTNTQNIAFGQKYVLSADGLLRTAVDLFLLPSKQLCKRLCCLIMGSDNSISVMSAMEGSVTLTPALQAMVWFDTELDTSIMFLTASNSIEISFDASHSQTVSYGGQDPSTGQWTIGESDGTSPALLQTGYGNNRFFYEPNVINPHSFAYRV
jgi:hypothetical protein